MEAIISDYVKLKISNDSMSAMIYLSSTPDDEGVVHTDLFTLENLTALLEENGVKAGIDEPLLKSVVIDKLYDRPIVIAKGNPAVDGTDGHYEYHFNTELDNKPKVQPDGSVDYRDIDIYEPIAQDTEVVTYFPATPGHFGFNVFGEIIQPVPGKDLPVLTGSGFTISEDKNHYYSTCNGKIEIKDGQLNISDILNIKGDVDMTTGNIVFCGDLLITGSVLAGSSIRVAGNVVIMGNVEGATIIADGNVEIKSGMQGGGKGIIECGGDLWGKFFEQTTIKVKGDLHANSMMNCTVVCEGNVNITGRHGCIVGGSVSSQGSIEATVVGNLAEVPTKLSVGVTESVLTELSIIKDKMKELNDSLDKHTLVREKLEAIKNPTELDKYNTMVEQVRSSMEEISKQMATLQAQLDQKLFLLSTYSNSSIKVDKYMYPNVNVIVSGYHYHSHDTIKAVTLKAIGGSIQALANI